MSLNNGSYALTVVHSKEELLARFREPAWPLCTAFQLEDLVFANTSRATDKTQEYTVLHEDHQIESLSVSKMTPHDLSMSLDWLLQGGGTFLGVMELETEPAASHGCAKCR